MRSQSFTYNDADRTMLSEVFYPDERQHRKSYDYGEQILYHYDSLGRVISEEVFRPGDKSKRMITREYDDWGNRISYCWWIEDEKSGEYTKASEHRYEYNSEGILIADFSIRYPEKDTSRRNYYYNEQGLLIENPGWVWGIDQVEKTEYDSLNRKIRVATHDKNMMLDYISYEYNDKNQVIIEQHWKNDYVYSTRSQPGYYQWKKTEHFLYEYDEHGNWVKITYFEYGEEKTATRQITYYE